MMEAYLQEASEGMERLRWLVLRAFGVLPAQAAAREMSDADYVWCGLNLLLDRQTGRAEAGGEAGVNPGFDGQRFRERSGT